LSSRDDGRDGKAEDGVGHDVDDGAIRALLAPPAGLERTIGELRGRPSVPIS
jgi:hypothetical protein